MKRFIIASALISIIASALPVAPAAAANLQGFTPDAFRPNPGSRYTPSPSDLLGSRYYPLDAQLQNEKGVVGVKVILTEEGRTKAAEIESSSGSHRLDEAALKMVTEKYRYNPASGEDMPETARVTVKFDLN